jgi:hypothetical protein
MNDECGGGRPAESANLKRAGVLRITLIGVLAIASAALVLSGWASARSAIADPADDPCPLSMAFVCRFVPIAPELEGDVDLTKQQAPADPASSGLHSPGDSAVPVLVPQGTADICGNGCI